MGGRGRWIEKEAPDTHGEDCRLLAVPGGEVSDEGEEKRRGKRGRKGGEEKVEEENVRIHTSECTHL